MSTVVRIEAELIAVTARIERLSMELTKAKDWEAELTTSLRVLRRLAGRREQNGESHDEASQGDDDAGIALGPEASETEESTSSSRRSARGRSDIILRAEAALIQMLREKGDFIRQLDAVNRLRVEHGILIGAGIPGRETSDLSAALGAGKSALLYVTRRSGWGLTEWEGDPPGVRETTNTDTGTPASAPSTEETDLAGDGVVN